MPKYVKKYQNPEDYRERRNQERKKNYKKSQGYSKRPWTPEEDKLVLAHAIPDADLSKILGRSVGTIQVRRCKLKKELGF